MNKRDRKTALSREFRRFKGIRKGKFMSNSDKHYSFWTLSERISGSKDELTFDDIQDSAWNEVLSAELEVFKLAKSIAMAHGDMIVQRSHVQHAMRIYYGERYGAVKPQLLLSNVGAGVFSNLLWHMASNGLGWLAGIVFLVLLVVNILLSRPFPF